MDQHRPSFIQSDVSIQLDDHLEKVTKLKVKVKNYYF